MSAIAEKISHLSAKITKENTKRQLKVIEELKLLHNKFVVVSIDKASGNVASVFQKHYG